MWWETSLADRLPERASDVLAHRRLISVTVDLSHAQAGSLLGGSGSTASKGSGATLAGVLTATVGFSDYDAPVSVTVPPVSEVTNLDSILNLSGARTRTQA